MSLRSAWTTGKDDPFLQRTWNESIWKCDWSASERPINTDMFRIAQQPDAPLSRQDNDAPIVTDEYAVVGERWGHNNVLRSARMLPSHPDPTCKSVVVLFRLHVNVSLRTLETTVFVITYLFRTSLTSSRIRWMWLIFCIACAWFVWLCFRSTRTTLPASVFCDRD